MHFVNPLFLIALSALAIPVIIHLFNFRKYKKVYFTNVHFIAEIEQESKKRSQLKHLLILLMRLLAVACLVFAFAQPYLPSAIQQKKLAGKQAVSIYVDNSFSMEALATNGKLLEVAKQKALEIAAAYKPSDLFQLLTTDFEGKHQRFVNRDEFRNLLDEVVISPVVQPLSSVVKRQNDLLSGVSSANRSAYIISDFQKTSSDIIKIKPDSSISCFFIPVTAEKSNNLYIDSVWFDVPSQQANQAVKLKVRIRNASTDVLEKIPIKLTINEVQKAVASFSIDPNSEMVVTLPYTNNDEEIQRGTLDIIDYPITWDDRFYFTYPVSPSIPILSINQEKPNSYLNALYGNDSTIQFRNVNVKQLDYSSFTRFSLIILNGVESFSSGLSDGLNQYIKRGGNLVIFPAEKIDEGSYNSFVSNLGLPVYTGKDTTKLKIGELNMMSKLYADVFEKDVNGKIIFPDNIDFPSVFKHYIISGSTKTTMETLLKLQNGHPFLCVSGVGKGRIYLSAVPLEESWSNFIKHPLFVPTLYRLALLSQPNPSLYSITGCDDPIELKNDTIPSGDVYKIKKKGSDFEFIPEIKANGGPIL